MIYYVAIQCKLHEQMSLNQKDTNSPSTKNIQHNSCVV